ncbi:alpha/beta hydrolase fold-domain-containing protein [Piptocephalis cylindrospora]|uniref:Alpha/beta hydrolase fold-domain-containing protein n=1 Tax=Piptocephalis cylindrospora TaxID=1907219 RepID=A0A4P9Y993_9FUNG|nr:alpha/beta hydrolase fold-domain-containing protein [Piptocephalis cylindrospora]|eukprot:RKP15362.1 alpha/beta hydrolase fold-domain-containing protein [Piptocephalis cylindrospora]
MPLTISQDTTTKDPSSLDQLRRPHPRSRAFTRSGTTRATLQPPRVPRGLLTSLGNALWNVPSVTKRRAQGKSHHPDWSFRTEYTTACLRFALDAPDPTHQRRLASLTRTLGRLRPHDLVVTPVKDDSGQELGIWTWLRTGIEGGLDPNTTAPLHAPIIDILFIHGGGFISGHPSMHLRTYQHFLKALASASGGTHFFRLFAFSYPLAPEHPYPAAPNAILATYEHLCSRGSIDPSRTLLMGESSGGLLAVDLLNQLHAHHPFLVPLGSILISPWTDLRTHAWNGGVTKEDTRKDYLSPRTLLGCTEAYLSGSGMAPHDPRISPILTRDMSHLPPILISTGSSELLRGSIAAFYERAHGRFGVRVALDVAPSMPHAHPFHSTAYPKEAHRSWVRMAKWAVRRVTRGRTRTGSFISAPPTQMLPFTLTLPSIGTKEASSVMTRARRRSSTMTQSNAWFRPTPHRGSCSSCAGCVFLAGSKPKGEEEEGGWFHPLARRSIGEGCCGACQSFLYTVGGKRRASTARSIPWFSPAPTRTPYGGILEEVKEKETYPSTKDRTLSASSSASSTSHSQCTIAVSAEEDSSGVPKSDTLEYIEHVDTWFRFTGRSCVACSE